MHVIYSEDYPSIFIFIHVTCNKTSKYITMWFNRHTTDRNYSGEQKVNFESPVPFSKCLRAKSYSNMNVHFDPQGCQTLLLKESEPFLLSLGSWTICILYLVYLYDHLPRAKLFSMITVRIIFPLGIER